MYKQRPLQENFEITHKPTCMYAMKNLYEKSEDLKVSSEKVSSDKVIENSVSTNDLIKLQQKINERLVSLEKRVDKLLLASNNGGKKIDFDKFEKLSSSFKKVEKKQIVNETVRDIVIQLDPDSISYSIPILFYQLCSKFKCFVQFFTHGSTIESSKKNSYCNNLQEFFKQLKLNLNESRLSYDYGLTIVWKKSDVIQNPVMYSDSSKSSPVYGESNILRFLSRLLLDQSYEKTLIANQVALVDDLIDSCTNEFKNSKEAKSNNSFLKNLNEKLKNSKFLVLANSVTIADIYIWSILKQKSNDSYKNFKQLTLWLENIESIDLFQLFQCLN